MSDTILALGPTWLAGFGLNIIFLLVALVLAKNVWPSFRPSLGTIIGFAALVSVYSATQSILGLRQAERLARAKVESSPPREVPAPASDRTPEQLRADFLNTVDSISLQPDSLTPESKAALFKQFGALFPRGDADRLEYAKNILLAYQCQQFVFEDALATLKSKKVVKSAQQTECEQVSGQFFGREKMIPAEVANGNGAMMTKLAQGKVAADVPTEDALRGAHERQIKRIETVRKLFQ